MSDQDERFPIGVPLNRPPPVGPKPIPGRPNWIRTPDGKEHYGEPIKPPPPSAISARNCATGLSPVVLKAAAAVTRAKLDQLGACWRARSVAELGAK